MRFSTHLQERIDAAVKVIRGSGIVAVPTDTLYGLAGSGLDEAAVARVFALKGRPGGMALPLLLSSTDQIPTYAAEVSPLAWALVGRFWPGPLTLVLPKTETVPDLVTGGRDTVALRVPDHGVPRAIVQALGAPITGTSANRTGMPGLRTAADVRRELGDSVDLILDTGEATGGVASTILDLSGPYPRILRQGAIGRAEIEELSGQAVARLSPGPDGESP